MVRWARSGLRPHSAHATRDPRPSTLNLSRRPGKPPTPEAHGPWAKGQGPEARKMKDCPRPWTLDPGTLGRWTPGQDPGPAADA